MMDCSSRRSRYCSAVGAASVAISGVRGGEVKGHVGRRWRGARGRPSGLLLLGSLVGSTTSRTLHLATAPPTPKGPAPAHVSVDGVEAMAGGNGVFG